MSGFGRDQFANFDPSAMSAFDNAHFAQSAICVVEMFVAGASVYYETTARGAIGQSMFANLLPHIMRGSSTYLLLPNIH